MKRWVLPIGGLGCLGFLVVLMFGRALFLGELFVYRDAGHFYYPLYLTVQREWEAGRWPLWEPQENGGMPLLGNPTSAALYPGKLLYGSRLWSYAWGSRLYTVAHSLLAVAAMYALLRQWRVSRSGSALSALAYGFGGPILFQYCNIIYLVGAAWAPLGLRAVDRWLRCGRRFALVELAVVLALQSLGGDPQTAYLTGLCAAGYAVGLALPRGSLTWSWKAMVIGLGLIALWIGGTLAAAVWFPGLLWRKLPDKPLPKAREFPWLDPLRNQPLSVTVPQLLNLVGAVVAVLIWLAVLIWVWKKLRDGGRSVFLRGILGLIVSGAIGGAITGAQLLPVLEFTSLSLRSAEEAPHEIYSFSLLPHRAVEWLWPDFYGPSIPENRSWLETLPPRNPAKVWVPSLYLGGLTLVLAVGAFGFRHGPPWRAWMSAIVLVSALTSLGEYAGPLWWARFAPPIREVVGPHDPPDSGSIRFDMNNLDGDGSPYWLLTRLLPGFRSFRFPAKLLTFTCLGLAALAGIGWDRLTSGDRSRFKIWGYAFLSISLAALLAAGWVEPWFREFLERRAERSGGIFGPLDVAGACHAVYRALLHASLVQALGLVVLELALRRAALAGLAALLLLTVDLGVANSGMIHTLPQSIYERTPKLLEVIRQAEREAGQPAGPYRVHRMPLWNPPAWFEARDPNRLRRLVEWEHDTLQPKYGLMHGMPYTITEGTTELYDLWFFFAPFERTLLSEEVASPLGLKAGDRIVYFPRRGFDLWNTRYFIVPFVAAGWRNDRRGFAAFLPDSTLIEPSPDALGGPDRQARALEWGKHQDWQVYRNDAAFPRAWVVHDVRLQQPLVGFKREDREERMIPMLHPADAFWNDPRYPSLNLRELAFVETDDPPPLMAELDRQPPGPSESVRVARWEPRRVVLDVELERPGLVVLADVFYPGWRLRTNGQDAPILRTNRLMRGALVPAGRHQLVYTYEPDSFRWGLRISAAGLAALAALAAWSGFGARRSRAGGGLLPEASPIRDDRPRDGEGGPSPRSQT